jgi:leucyl-tRNA synthetase
MGAARREALETLARLAAPMMPHLAEEVFVALNPGATTLVAEMPWPEADPALLKAETVTLAVQVLGKLRATIEVPAGETEERIFALAEADENVQRAIGGKPVKKRIHVPGRVVNLVV